VRPDPADAMSARTLKLTQPPLEGADVTSVIRALRRNGFYRGNAKSRYTQGVADAVRDFQATHLGPGATYLASDGEVGPATRWALGNASGDAQRSGLTRTTREGLFPETGDLHQRFAVMANALECHGDREIPNGSNRGREVAPFLPRWARAAPGFPWCCFFAWAIFKRATGEWPLDDNQHRGGVASAKALAVKRKRWIANKGGELPVPGDFLVILYPGTGRGHIAIVLAVRYSEAGNRLVYTVGGNEGNRVKVGLRCLDDKAQNIAGWIDTFGDSREQAGEPWTFAEYQTDDAARLTVAGTR